MGCGTFSATTPSCIFHFTVTGLGGTAWRQGCRPPGEALRQLAPLVEIAGQPGRVSLRFDPVITWREAGREMTNLRGFADLADEAASLGIRDIRFSFAQWYGKSRRRAARRGFDYVDPPDEEKLRAAAYLAGIARERGLRLYSCSQDFLTAVPGVEPSACIDGRLLQFAPSREGESLDRQRPVAATRLRLHRVRGYRELRPGLSPWCVYCYANPKGQAG